MKAKLYICVVCWLAVLASLFSTSLGENRAYALILPGGDFFPAINPPNSLSAMTEEDNRFLRFINQGFKPLNYNYFENIPNGMNLDKKEYPELVAQNKTSVTTHSLFWGIAHDTEKQGQHRYIGYNPYGESIPNVLYPPDVNPAGSSFDTNKWIIAPWKTDNNKDTTVVGVSPKPINYSKRI
jgi:hypothetical protein